MAQPTPFNRLVNFVTYALAHPSAPYNASDHDSEHDGIETTLDAILTNLALIQRDDGALKNSSVHPDALSTATKALIGAGNTGQNNWTPLGLWVSATAYVVGDVVEQSSISYVCAVAHTSGTFATDKAAGKWIVLGQAFNAGASAITADAYGHIAATTVQDFLEELVDEKALTAGSASQTFSVSDATGAAHAVSMGQVQKSSTIHAVAGGTSDAITATLASGLTTLTNGQRVSIEATAANTTTAPTFNLTLGSTATGAKTIKKGAASALVAGDIAGAGHKLDLEYYSTGDCWLLLNPAYAPGISTAGVEPDTVENFGIAFSVGSGALTATVKTSSGGTPTSSDQVKAALRNSSASTGTYNTRTISATLSLTISSTSTLGHQDAAPGVLHWYLIDNAGTLELAVSSHFFGFSGIVSTTAEGGAGAADSAIVMYSASARSSVSFVWVARTIDTQTTAGTWASTPTFVSLVRSLEHALLALTPGEIYNGKVSLSVGSNALTIAIKTLDGNDPSSTNPVWAAIQSSTLTTPNWNVRPIAAATSLVISSGSTLGHASGIVQHVFGYLIDNAGVIELAASNLPPDYAGTFGSVRRVSTTAEGGAGAADSATVVYSTTARTNVAWAALFMAKSNQATAGTWASAPSQIDMAPFSIPCCSFSASPSAGTSLTQNTDVKVTFATEEFDGDSVYDAANSRFQPNIAGVYRFGGALDLQTNPAGLLLKAFKNGAYAKLCGTTTIAATTNATAGSALILMNGTSDFLELYAFQSAATQNNNTAATATFIQGGKVG